MQPDDAVERARAIFLDEAHAHGCAETTFLVLAEGFGLPEAGDASAAMALNGGVAYSGGICGAISGAALTVGLLAGRSVVDHREAKRAAREAVADVMVEFEARFGAVDCRTLLGREIRSPEQHQAFLDSGVWRHGCMAQIVFVVERLAGLPADPRWQPSGE